MNALTLEHERLDLVRLSLDPAPPQMVAEDAFEYEYEYREAEYEYEENL